MEKTIVVGIAIIVAAYGLTWFLLRKSIRIVTTIAGSNLKHPREIHQRRRENGTPGTAE